MNHTARRLARTHTDLDVDRRAFEWAMRLFELPTTFPGEERYPLTDQLRRSSRSVCANLAEPWGKRRYEAAFVAKLSDSEAEAAETQVWIQSASQCKYLDRKLGCQFFKECDAVRGMHVQMLSQPQPWLLQTKPWN